MDTESNGAAAGMGRLRRKFGIYSGDSGLIRPLMTNQCAFAPQGRTAPLHMEGRSDVAIGKYFRSGPPRSRSADLSEMRSEDVAIAD
jgi:hypothetical protein